MKKIIAVLFILSVFFSFVSCSDTESPDETEDNVYATVNGEAITAEEIGYFRTRNRSDIINDFAEKYGITDFADFWNTEYDGITPAQALEKSALDSAVEAKIKLTLMRAYGIYENTDYASLRVLAEEYNASHANDSPTVGISSIDMETFYSYYITTGEMELKNRLADDILAPSEEEKKEYMAEHPDVTEEGAIFYIADARYGDYIASLIADAVITVN